MRTDKIILKWKIKNKYFKKEIKREEILEKFNGYIKEYTTNNSVSKKLAEIIPKATQFKINWDSTTEVNQVYYVINNKEAGFPIINLHCIVWGTWKDYCSAGEEISEKEFYKIG